MQIEKRAREWLQDPFDEQTKSEVRRLIETDPQGLSDAFFKELSFGTGGMRGLMGVGTNRLNIYTIRAATQGLANYLKKQPEPEQGFSVFIGYDVRHNSRLFAEETARVLAANEIHVLLTKDICPTPLVSYGCRHYGCSAAVMITASHNPPQYNGYKVYWSDGGQIVPPHDEGIIREVRAVRSLADIPTVPLSSPLIRSIGTELDTAYLSELKSLQLYPELAGSPLKILYTPLHGTGIRIIPQALKSWGYQHVHLVEEQKTPDGNFPHAASPNPEEHKALEIGTRKLLKDKLDLLIATDPDADRIGVVAAGEKLTGNQIACICLFHICCALQLQQKFPPNAAFIKTIVTTELFRAIATSFNAACIDVLTGFKYIGEQITLWENSFDAYQFLFGAEESYGYLFGTQVRDKDAISSACLIAEAAALAKKQNLTLVDRLYQIYQKFGVYRESLDTLVFTDSAEGMKQMSALMKRLRTHPPSSIAHQSVVSIEDYSTGKLPLPKSDVLRFWLQDGTKLVIRPSGTEPKIKLYIEVVQKEPKDINHSIVACDQRLKILAESFQKDLR
jgi:phosphoglucomutase/phosphomannomutase